MLEEPASGAAQARVASQGASAHTGEILVRLKPGRGASGLGGTARRLKSGALPDWVKLTPQPGETVEEAVARLRASGQVLAAQPNYVYHAHAGPNDPSYPDQWGLPAIALPLLWDTVTGRSEVVVAVLDTGVNFSLADYTGIFAANPADPTANGVDDDNNGRVDDTLGWDFVNNDNNPADDEGHGTFVAGVIAALRNNALGVAGVAGGEGGGPGVRVLPVKVLGANGSGSTEDIAAGIAYGVGRGAEVINMSLGQLVPDEALAEAVQNARASGVVLVASAGNGDAQNNPLAVEYPAAYPEVLAVGALQNENQRVNWSNHGSPLDLMAPGVNIAGYDLGGGVINRQGTSFAAPMVAGVAALLRSLNPDLPVDTLYDLLRQTAVDLGEPGFDNDYGYGRLNAKAAYDLMRQDTTPPSPVTSLPLPNALSNERQVFLLTATDDRSGLDLNTSTLTLLRNGVALPGATLGQWGGQLRLTLNTPIPPGPASDGPHQLRADLRDQTGNHTTYDVFFTLDTTAPTLTVGAPSALTGEATLTLSGQTSDTNGVTLTVNGAPVNLLEGQFTREVNLAPGQNQLTVAASDPLGNVNQQVFTVVYDNTGPQLTAISPPVDGFTSTTAPVVGATVLDTFSPVDFSASSLILNGQPCPTPLAFSQSAVLCHPDGPLPTGQNNAALTVADQWGNQTVFGWNFVVDPTPPALTLASVPTATKNDSVLVSGTVSDANLASVTVGGHAATLTLGQYLYTAALAPGPNTLTVVATDKAGNITTIPLTVTKDNTPPSLVVQSPAANLTTNQNPLLVTGFTDASLVSVGGQAASLAAGQFSLSVTLAEGVNNLSVAAHDAAGNVTLITRQVTLDTTAPTLTQPLPGAAVTRQSTLQMQVLVEGASLVQAGSLFFPVVGGAANLSIPLEEGLNLVSIRIKDNAGNGVEETLPAVLLPATGPPAPALLTAPLPAATSQSAVLVRAWAVAGFTSPSPAIAGVAAPGLLLLAQDFCTPDPCGDVQVLSFSAAVALTEGANSFTVATGQASPPPLTVQLVRDSLPPGLSALSPAFETVVKSPVTLTGLTEPGVKLVWLHGQTTAGQDGAFSLPLPTGVTAVDTSLQLTDPLGNTASLPVRFTVDDTPPTVLAISPPSGTVVGAGPVSVTVACDGCATVRYLSQSAVVAAGVATLSVTLGAPQVSDPITVLDEAGNVTTVAYQLFREAPVGDAALALSAGWNLVSLGQTGMDQVRAELGEGAWVLGYDPDLGYHEPTGQAQREMAYFILCPQPRTVHLDLPEGLLAKTLTLKPGWNLVAFSLLDQGEGLATTGLSVQDGPTLLPLSAAISQGLVSDPFAFDGVAYHAPAVLPFLGGFFLYAQKTLSLTAP